jgi:hypothetical protein
VVASESNLVLPIPFRVLRSSISFIGVWIALATIFAIKIPSSYKKIYAEDGASLQQSLENPFPQELFEPVAGYMDVLLRGAGAIVSLFPLDFAPQVFFLINTFLMASLWLSVFVSSRSLINSGGWRTLLATGLILLPIGNFESIANSANLHFYFMSACVLILLSTPKNRFEIIFLSSVVLLAASSIPLMLLTFPLVLIKNLLREKTARSPRDLAISFSWILGNVFQIVFILTVALGERKSSGINSPTEVLYLFLDRVLGSTIIPFWGMVSTSTETPIPRILGTSSYLILRAVVALSMLLVISLMAIKYSRFTSGERLMLITIIGTGLLHWLLVGTVFNPEPRYAVFSSFCFLASLIYVFQNLPGEFFLIKYIAVTILLFTWIGSWSPSTLRTEGPTWDSEFRKAQLECADGAKIVSITTTPINKNWQVKVDCRFITKNP